MRDLTTEQLDELQTAVEKMTQLDWYTAEHSVANPTALVLLRNNGEALIVAARTAHEAEQRVEAQAREIAEFIDANQGLRERIGDEWAARAEVERVLAAPVPIVIHCPQCHLQHVDVDDDTGNWATSRLHKKHLCKPSDGGCGFVWAPSDRHTVGVRALPGGAL